MRVYATLLGVLITAGSGYLAQVAVGSAGFERLVVSAPKPGTPTFGEIWYGGVLAPVTIEVARPTNPAIAFGGPWILTSELAVSQKAVECARLARTKPARASLGSMM